MNATETAILPAYRRVAGAQVEAVIPAESAPLLALSTVHKIRFDGFTNPAVLAPFVGAAVVGALPGGHPDIVAIVFHGGKLPSPANIEVLAKPLQTPWSRAASIRAFDPEESNQ